MVSVNEKSKPIERIIADAHTPYYPFKQGTEPVE